MDVLHESAVIAFEVCFESPVTLEAAPALFAISIICPKHLPNSSIIILSTSACNNNNRYKV